MNRKNGKRKLRKPKKRSKKPDLEIYTTSLEMAYTHNQNDMRFDILTIFPKAFESYFNESMIKRAKAKKIIDIYVHDIRTFSKDKHKKVDHIPYGGGPGMVMTPQPIYDAIKYVKKFNKGPVLL